MNGLIEEVYFLVQLILNTARRSVEVKEDEAENYT